MSALPYDVANFNLINFANAYNDIFDSEAKDVDIQVKDENGNITTKTVSNRGMFKQQLWDDVGGALGQFDRTFYVDAVNGDDNNDGSSSNPFKTIQKVLDIIPVGGQVYIILKSDYIVGDGENNIVEYWNLCNKAIRIYTEHLFEIKYKAKIEIYTYNMSTISFVFYSGGKIKIGKEDGIDYGGFFIHTHEMDHKFGVIINLNMSFVSVTNTNLIEIEDGGVLFKSRPDGRGNRVNLSIADLYCDGSVYRLNGTSYIYKNNNGCGSFIQRADQPLKDENDNSKTWNDVFTDIYTDVDSGNPINLISNINFSN